MVHNVGPTNPNGQMDSSDQIDIISLLHDECPLPIWKAMLEALISAGPCKYRKGSSLLVLVWFTIFPVNGQSEMYHIMSFLHRAVIMVDGL